MQLRKGRITKTSVKSSAQYLGRGHPRVSALGGVRLKVILF
jgi:hypothetical protein